MATINSVLGPMDTADLGFTLSHEHVLIASAGIQYVYPEFLDREGSIQRGIAELSAAYSEGLRSMIDVTTIDLGRDIRFDRAGIAGIWCQHHLRYRTWRDIPRVFWTATPDMIAPLYIREIEEGIEGTGIRAGIIKVANDVGRCNPGRGDHSACGRPRPEGHRGPDLDAHMGAGTGRRAAGAYFR